MTKGENKSLTFNTWPSTKYHINAKGGRMPENYFITMKGS